MDPRPLSDVDARRRYHDAGPMSAGCPCAKTCSASTSRSDRADERRAARATSARCARSRCSAAAVPRGSSGSTRWASSRRANGSSCCSTRDRSSNSTRSSRTGRPRSADDEPHVLGDGVVTGHGTIDGRLVFVFSPGLHGLRRIAVGGVRREDLQGHGPGDEGRRADHRPQRFRRRADPGGRRLARRLRRHLPAQRPGLRRRPADLGDPGSVRRGRGVLAGDDRLHGHGRGHELHVRDRPERREGRDPRGRRFRTTRRRAPPTRRGAASRIWPAATRPRRSTSRADPRVPAAEQSRDAATPPSDRSRRSTRRGAGHDRARRSAQPIRHARRHRCDRRRRRVPRDPARLGGEHHHRLRATRRPQRRHRRAAAGGAGRRARHRRVDQGRAVRPNLRLLQRPAGDVRRRAGLPAGRRPGARRDHQARRQAAVRLLRGDRPEVDGDHPQGLRRRVRRHEQQAHPRRHELRVADGRDRGDGRRGRGQHHLQGRNRRGGRPGRRATRGSSRSTRPSSRTRTSPRRAATSTT